MPNPKNIDFTELSKTNLDSFNILKCDPGTFDGGTADARGEIGGAKAVLPLFKVSGTVLLRIFGICTTTLVGAGTLEVGMAGNTAGLLAQITDATTLIKGEIWNDATPTELTICPLTSITGPFVVTGEGTPTTIDEKVASTDITAGGLHYLCLWRPLSPDGIVESLF